MPQLTPAQLTGIDESHLVDLPGGHRLHPQTATALQVLQEDARGAGFELQIASSYRSFERQLAIWNGKASGQRPVHDDAGEPVPMAALSAQEKIHAIMRFSALPGTSRHHWGTDLDIYDAAAVAADYTVQLTPQEVAPGGPFDELHKWLDRRMAEGRSQGFFRPYGRDRGGVAPERWHISYAPLSLPCGGIVDERCLRQCWQQQACQLELQSDIERNLGRLLERYVEVGSEWCEYT